MSTLELIQSLPKNLKSYDAFSFIPIPLPTPIEIELFNSIDSDPNFLGKIKELRNKITFQDAFHLWTFAARMAIYSVRKQDSKYLKCGFYCLIIDSEHIDYREALDRLSIIDHCSRIINFDFDAFAKSLLDICSDSMRGTIEHGFLVRDLSGRDISGFGYTAYGEKEEFQMSKKGFRRPAN